ncbi:DUF6777 domain-containing protein [Streptomyces sp. ITFR-16]|uniref:DUF6777 domain-containing protein n=1 Tax=Streptomyces sp. ITFR-16 TaxID=3075198 RepID=UPI00288B0480|nr:DUF6777 domain-containing protein [Streptomyces sp. ITFR-16]WNI20886.1 DUF6777-containing protein [Streptomyces sp. ITFR-16]
MHSRIRLRRTAFAALSAGILLAAGCARETSGGGSGTTGAAGAEDVVLQPAAGRGSDPFTGSTAKTPGAGPDASRPGERRTTAPGGRTLHILPGSTPGLYAGTRSAASCDVEEQIRFLAADPAREKAFAQAAGVAESKVPDFLRGLTPVLLSADTRVGNHGFRAGAATSFQSVLQAGTAVMVDSHGLPRVRCACGNPLSPPAGLRDASADRGERWAGYDPGRIVVVEPAARPVSDLMIVDVEHGTWIQRPSGDEGAGDRTPAVPPPYDPGTDLTRPLPDASPRPKPSKRSPGPSEPTPSRSLSPEDCPTPEAPTPPGEPAAVTEGPGEWAGDCPTPTGVPSGDPTDGYPEPFPELPTDEPPGVPTEPDEPPEDLVPLMTDEPQTSIRLPRRDGDQDAPGDIAEPAGW